MHMFTQPPACLTLLLWLERFYSAVSSSCNPVPGFMRTANRGRPTTDHWSLRNAWVMGDASQVTVITRKLALPETEAGQT